MLFWTNDLPIQIGWYWRRDKKGPEKGEVTIVKVRDYGGELAVHNSTISNWDKERYDWAGPIEEPIENPNIAGENKVVYLISPQEEWRRRSWVGGPYKSYMEAINSDYPPDDGDTICSVSQHSIRPLYIWNDRANKWLPFT